MANGFLDFFARGGKAVGKGTSAAYEWTKGKVKSKYDEFAKKRDEKRRLRKLLNTPIAGIPARDYFAALQRAGRRKLDAVRLMKWADENGFDAHKFARAIALGGPPAIDRIDNAENESSTEDIAQAFINSPRIAPKLIPLSKGDEIGKALTYENGDTAINRVSNFGKDKRAVAAAAKIINSHEHDGVEALRTSSTSLGTILHAPPGKQRNVVAALAAYKQDLLFAIANHGYDVVDLADAHGKGAVEVLMEEGPHRLPALQKGGAKSINFVKEFGNAGAQAVDYDVRSIDLVHGLDPDFRIHGVEAINATHDDAFASIGAAKKMGLHNFAATALAQKKKAAAKLFNTHGVHFARQLAEQPEKTEAVLKRYGADAAGGLHLGNEALELMYRKGRTAAEALGEGQRAGVGQDTLKLLTGERGDDILPLLHARGPAVFARLQPLMNGRSRGAKKRFNDAVDDIMAHGP